MANGRESVCVDASLVLETWLGDRYRVQAGKLLRRWFEGDVAMVMPPLFHSELVSNIRLRVFTGRLNPAEAERLVSKSVSFPAIIWRDHAPLHLRAFEFATRFNQPRAYDAQYLAVADLIGCELWTADQRLYNTVSGHLPWVRYIGEAT